MVLDAMVLGGDMMTLSKYHISNEEQALFDLVARKHAYWDFVDEYENGEYEGFEPTDDEVERIIDFYLEERRHDTVREDEIDDMRAAIDNVMRHDYKVEVHYVSYDTWTVSARSEKEAHRIVKERFKPYDRDHFIKVIAAGTVAIGDEDLPESWDDESHVTRWE